MRCKKATALFLGSGFVALTISGFVIYFYVATWTWTTKQLVIFISVALPVTMWIWHFYIWKTDRLILRRDVRDA